MKPGIISDSNLLLTAPLDNPEAMDLHVRDEKGVLKMVWVSSTFRERLIFLLTGEVYISVLSMVSMPPIRASVKDD